MSTKGTYLYAHAMYNYAIFYYVWIYEISLKTLYSHYAIYCKSLPSLLGASFIHFYNTPSKTFRWHHGMKQGGKRTISKEDNGRLPPEESRICFQSLLFGRLRYVIHFHLKAMLTAPSLSHQKLHGLDHEVHTAWSYRIGTSYTRKLR